MSVIKQLSKRTRRWKIHSAFLGAFIIVATVLGFLQSKGQQGSLVFRVLLVAFAVSGVVMAVTRRPYRCPDCGQRLRDHYDHPKSQETYLYYCRQCDVIWDSLIPRSSD